MDARAKTPQRYWESLWRDTALPRPVRPRARGVNHFVDRAYHRAFLRALPAPPGGRAGGQRRLLEAGCAQSAWLPYFAREHGFAVTGIDYSPTGCERARQLLAAEGVAGEIVCADFSTPPPELLGAFDAVVSFGVVEHFEDTAAALRALARFLAPGGVLIATVPNMAGLVGRVQRTLDRATFELHRALSVDALRAAAQAAGLTEVSCRPFLLFNLGAVSLARLRPHPLLHAAARLALLGSSRAVWAVQRLGGEDATHPWLAPYLWCSGALPAAGASAYTRNVAGPTQQTASAESPRGGWEGA